MFSRWLFLLWLGITSAATAQELLTIPSISGGPSVPGYWFPAQSDQPAPVVIGLHGCGGALTDDGQLSSKWKELATWFNREGMHFLVPDSFTPRGQKSICETPSSHRSIDEADRREDVFSAIRWLSKRSDIDVNRIVVAGWSHGAQTVLKVLDRTDSFVRAQPIQPRAAVAFYPGCSTATKMFRYEISAPLLLMIGERDDWTPARACTDLQKRLSDQKDAALELIVFPESYHGFDGTSPVQIRKNVGNTRSGTATVGGNPQAREQSRIRMFDFLAEKLDRPLRLSHAERFFTHSYATPPASDFAKIDDLTAVPLAEKGKSRYAHYLTLPKPKAFVITEKGGWYFNANHVDAMQAALDHCPAGSKCWLYAVDDSVVWHRDPAKRIARVTLSAEPGVISRTETPLPSP